VTPPEQDVTPPPAAGIVTPPPAAGIVTPPPAAGIVMERPDRASDREPVPPEQVGRWRGRPVLAAALKSALVLGPLTVSLLTSYVLHLALGGWLAGHGRWASWGTFLLFGVGTAVAVERVTRRFLPLPMLMRLTLVFPDQAPSRYKVVRAAASPARLKEIADSGSATSDAATQVLALVAELARHDRHTRGHSERVRVFTDLIAEELGIDGLDRDKLRWSALVHDIGKLDVPAAILNKPGRPDQDEWAVLQGHPAAGETRSGALFAWLGEWAGGITEHHERWDGKGYPRRLSGTDITLAGRAVAVADAYETMTAARAYKKPMATAAARQELSDCAGAQFDPAVVRAFLAISLPRLMWRVGPLSFLAHLPFLGSLQAVGQTAVSTAATAAAPAALAGVTAVAAVIGTAPAPAPAAPVQPVVASVPSPGAPAPTVTGREARPAPRSVPAPTSAAAPAAPVAPAGPVAAPAPPAPAAAAPPVAAPKPPPPAPAAPAPGPTKPGPKATPPPPPPRTTKAPKPPKPSKTPGPTRQSGHGKGSDPKH
jgi:hypothetical protein